MSKSLQIQALEYHGSCTEAGVLVFVLEDPIDGAAPSRVGVVRSAPDTLLVLSDVDGRLHAPSAQYHRSEGLTACASRALYDWTAGALAIAPEKLAASPIVCSDTSVFFLVFLDRDTACQAASSVMQNVSRSRHPNLPRALIHHTVNEIVGQHSYRDQLVENISTGTAAALLRYAEALASPAAFP
jgi:hypothetical protein